MTTMYAATVEVARQDFDGDTVMSRLASFSAGLGQSERGWASATITLPAESLDQAAQMATVLVASAFGADAIACEVMSEQERDARQGWSSTPSELVSVTEAAELLGMSRQGVLDGIRHKRIQAVKVGREWTINRASLRPRAASGDRR